MASFKTGSLTRDIYLEWFDLLQGEAIHHGVWKFIDPSITVPHTEPKKQHPSDYSSTASKLNDLDEDDKIMFREEFAQYRVDFQLYKQEYRLIGGLRAKIKDSLQENHRKLIFGFMNYREDIKQIKRST